MTFLEGGVPFSIRDTRGRMVDFFEGQQPGSPQFIATGDFLILERLTRKISALQAKAIMGQSVGHQDLLEQLEVRKTILELLIERQGFITPGYETSLEVVRALTDEMEKAIIEDGDVDDPRESAIEDVERVMRGWRPTHI